MSKDGSIRSSIPLTRDLLNLSYLLFEAVQFLLVLLFSIAMNGCVVITTDHSPVFLYTGELCNAYVKRETGYRHQWIDASLDFLNQLITSFFICD